MRRLRRRVPRALVLRVNQDVHAVVAAPAMKEQFISRGLEIVLSTPEEFARYIRTEIERWSKVVRDAGIRAQRCKYLFYKGFYIETSISL